jgi:hypothetical protein
MQFKAWNLARALTPSSFIPVLGSMPEDRNEGGEVGDPIFPIQHIHPLFSSGDFALKTMPDSLE